MAYRAVPVTEDDQEQQSRYRAVPVSGGDTAGLDNGSNLRAVSVREERDRKEAQKQAEAERRAMVDDTIVHHATPRSVAPQAPQSPSAATQTQPVQTPAQQRMALQRRSEQPTRMPMPMPGVSGDYVIPSVQTKGPIYSQETRNMVESDRMYNTPAPTPLVVERDEAIRRVEESDADGVLSRLKPTSFTGNDPAIQRYFAKAVQDAGGLEQWSKLPVQERRVRFDKATAEMGDLPQVPWERGVGQVWAENTDKKAGVVPFLGAVPGAVDLGAIYLSSKRIEDGTATQEDEQRLMDFTVKSQLDALRENTVAGGAAEIGMSLPGFMLEFIATQPVYAAGKRIGEETVKETIGRASRKMLEGAAAKKATKRAGAIIAGEKTAEKLAGVTTGAAAQSLALGHRIPESYIQRRLQGDSAADAAWKAPLDNFIEIFSEHTGGAIPVGKMGGLKKTVGKWLGMTPNATADDFVNAALKRMAYHGPLGEIGEEELGKAMRTALLGDPYEVTTPKELASQAIAFSVPEVAGGALSMVGGKPAEPPQQIQDAIERQPVLPDRRPEQALPPRAASSQTIEEQPVSPEPDVSPRGESSQISEQPETPAAQAQAEPVDEQARAIAETEALVNEPQPEQAEEPGKTLLQRARERAERQPEPERESQKEAPSADQERVAETVDAGGSPRVEAAGVDEKPAEQEGGQEDVEARQEAEKVATPKRSAQKGSKRPPAQITKSDALPPESGSKSQDKSAKHPWETSLKEWRENPKVRPSGTTQKRWQGYGGSTASQIDDAIDAGHRLAVEQAIARGDIDSHPDYPDLTKPAATPKETKGTGAQAQVKKPWDMSRDEWAKSGDGRDYDRMLWSAYADDKVSKEYVTARVRTGYMGGEKQLWAQTRKEIEADRKADIKAKRGRRAAVNKLGKSGATVKWSAKSQSNTIKNEIESTNRYYDGLLEVHKSRVQEAIADGKPVPAEVLADYPELGKPASPAKPTSKASAQKDTKRPDTQTDNVPAFSPDLPKYSIYGVTVGGKPMYAIRSSENTRGMGDELHETPEQARRGADEMRKRDADRAKSQARAAAEKKAKDEADAKAKAEKEDLDGFGDDLPDIQRRRIVGVLSKEVQFNDQGKYRTTTRKAIIRDTIENRGGKIETINGKKRLVRDDDRIIDGGAPTTEIRYAEHLIAKKASGQNRTQKPTSADVSIPPAAQAKATVSKNQTVPTHRLVDRQGNTVSEHLTENAAKDANDRAGKVHKVEKIKDVSGQAEAGSRLSDKLNAKADELAERRKKVGLRGGSRRDKGGSIFGEELALLSGEMALRATAKGIHTGKALADFITKELRRLYPKYAGDAAKVFGKTRRLINAHYDKQKGVWDNDGFDRELNEMSKQGPKPKQPTAKQVIAESTGVKKTSPKVVTTEAKALRERIRTMALQARRSAADQRATAERVVDVIKDMRLRGTLTPAQAKSILKRAARVNFSNIKGVELFADYAGRVAEKANYAFDLARARREQQRAKKKAKSKSVPANYADVLGAITRVKANMLDDPGQFADRVADFMRTFLPQNKAKYQAADTGAMLTYLEGQQKQANDAEKALRDKMESAVTDNPDVAAVMESDDVDAMVEDIGKDRAAKLDKALSSVANESRDALRSRYSPAGHTGSEDHIAQTMLRAPIDRLSIEQKRDYIRAVDNITINDAFYGAQKVESALLAAEAMPKAEKVAAGVRIRRMFPSKINYTIRSVSDIFRGIYGLGRAMAGIQVHMGATRLAVGYQKTNTQLKAIENEYNRYIGSVSKQHKGMNKHRAVLSEGLAGFMMQTVPGKTAEESHAIRRSIILEDIAEKKKYRSTRAEGELIDSLMGELDGPTIEDVMEKMDALYPGNAKVVRFLRDELLPKYRDQLAEHDSLFNNQSHNYENPNYLPISFRRVPREKVDMEDDGALPLVEHPARPKQAGNTIKRREYESLPKDRLVNYNLRQTAWRSLSESLLRSNTNPAVEQIRQFLKMPDAEKVFGGPENLSMVTLRFNELHEARSKSAAGQTASSQIVDSAANMGRKYSVSAALGGVYQLAKQAPDQLITAITGLNFRVDLLGAGMVDLTKPSAKAMLSKFSIGSRGDISGGVKWVNSIEVANDRMVRALRAGHAPALKQAGNRLINLWTVALRSSDSFAAQSAWLAFYRQNLKEQGVKFQGWAKESQLVDTDARRQEAATYAESMIDITQVSSDASKMAELTQRGRGGWENLGKALLIPYSSFRIQAASRLISDAGDVLTWRNPWRSGRSMAGTMAGMAAFNAVKIYVLDTVTRAGVAALLEVLDVDWDGGDDDELRDFRFKKWYSNTASDILVGSLPEPAQERAIDGLNFVAYQYGVYFDRDFVKGERGKTVAWSTFKGKYAPIYRYHKWRDTTGLGMFDVAVDRPKMVYDEATDAYRTAKRTDISDRQKSMAYISLMSELLYTARMNDADVYRLISRAKREWEKALPEKKKKK